jgi:methionyl-tRNA formyltransferase
VTDLPGRRVVFVGSKSMGVRVLETMIADVSAPHTLVGAITLDDRDDARSCLGRLRDVAGAARLPLVVARDARDGHSALADMRPDIAILCGWYAMVPLRGFRAAFFGFHAGPLPRYRGGAPVVWQIIEGERSIGLTLFRLSSRADAGDVVARSHVPLGPNETVATALGRLDDLAVRLLRRSLPRILDGSVRLTPQDHARATTYPQRSPRDGEIDLTRGARRVHDFVRAQTAPYPGAFVRSADGRILRVWRTEPMPDRDAEAGSLTVTADGAIIGCGEGSVRILSASIDGEPQRPLADLLRGIRPRPRSGRPS